jgi:hypothetical protein
MMYMHIYAHVCAYLHAGVHVYTHEQTKYKQEYSHMHTRIPQPQVREHTWKTVIVDARREFVVNKLKLEAFETEERQVPARTVRTIAVCLHHSLWACMFKELCV